MEIEQRLRSLYAAFNARDIDAVLAATSQDVDWPNAWEGGRMRGREAMRAYWTRQWAAIDPRVEPRTIAMRPDGSVSVDVHQVVRTLEGQIVAENDVVHLYEIRGGFVTRMDVVEPRSPA
jgi:hypothetical protein